MPRRLPEALGSYAARPVARFHMPGHKGRGMAGFFRPELIGWDITELSFSDNLSNPEDAILDAQATCAKRYKAEHTFFLVNGSTAGLHALLLMLPRGSRLLLGRDCHRAVLSGAALAGHTCRFIQPLFIEEHSLSGCVTADAVERALLAAPADAVLLTSPNYYGLCADIPALCAIARRHGALLFVDAAHGAHFPFSDLLPSTPAGYADAWVNSAHKTLNALGQAALLHVDKTLSIKKVQRALSMVQTSSPSYLLLSSLDWARYTADLPGVWTDAVHACRTLAAQIDRLLGLWTLPRALVKTAGIADMDATRIVIDVSERGITGYEAQAALEKQGVFIEMADTRRLVCICTPSDDPQWYRQLLKALHALPYGMPVLSPEEPMPPLSSTEQAMPLHEAARANVRSVALQQAAGCVAADAVGIYPPGIPLWVPGERITQEFVAFLQTQQRMGATLFGAQQHRVMVVDI